MSIVIADVSVYQGAIHWPAYDRWAVIIRAFNGYHVDAMFGANRAGARANPTIRFVGFYAYLSADRDAATQAREFLSVVGPLRGNEFICPDLEEGSGDQSARLNAWVDAARAAGVPASRIIPYSGAYFWRGQLTRAYSWLRRWVAGYPYEGTQAHVLWQFSNHQFFPGIGYCDASVYHGSVSDFAALIGVVPSTPVVEKLPDPGDEMILLAKLSGGAAAPVFVYAGGYRRWLKSKTEVTDVAWWIKSQGGVPYIYRPALDASVDNIPLMPGTPDPYAV